MKNKQVFNSKNRGCLKCIKKEHVSKECRQKRAAGEAVKTTVEKLSATAARNSDFLPNSGRQGKHSVLRLNEKRRRTLKLKLKLIPVF